MIVSRENPLLAVIGSLGFLFDGEKLYMRSVGRSKMGSHLEDRRKWLKRQQKRRKHQREREQRNNRCVASSRRS